MQRRRRSPRATPQTSMATARLLLFWPLQIGHPSHLGLRGRPPEPGRSACCARPLSSSCLSPQIHLLPGPRRERRKRFALWLGHFSSTVVDCIPSRRPSLDFRGLTWTMSMSRYRWPTCGFEAPFMRDAMPTGSGRHSSVTRLAGAWPSRDGSAAAGSERYTSTRRKLKGRIVRYTGRLAISEGSDRQN